MGHDFKGRCFIELGLSILTKKKILLTGVTGFLGSHLAKKLLSVGHEVVALKRKTSSIRRIEPIASEMTLLDSDGADFDALFNENPNIDAIIHTATSYGRQNETVSDIFTSNTMFPLHLLDAGSRAGVPLFINTDTILDKYLNLYSLSKNQLLQWGTFFSIHKRVKFINLKLEHFYGLNDDPTKFTAFIIDNCIRNISEIKLTSGEQKRDFIYIDDVVSAYIKILDNTFDSDKSFIEYDVGSGQSVSIREFVETVHKLTSSQTILNFGAIPYREGEIMNSTADTSGLLALGWQCKFDLTTGLKLVINQSSAS